MVSLFLHHTSYQCQELKLPGELFWCSVTLSKPRKQVAWAGGCRDQQSPGPRRSQGPRFLLPCPRGPLCAIPPVSSWPGSPGSLQGGLLSVPVPVTHEKLPLKGGFSRHRPELGLWAQRLCSAPRNGWQVGVDTQVNLNRGHPRERHKCRSWASQFQFKSVGCVFMG